MYLFYEAANGEALGAVLGGGVAASLLLQIMPIRRHSGTIVATDADDDVLPYKVHCHRHSSGRTGSGFRSTVAFFSYNRLSPHPPMATGRVQGAHTLGVSETEELLLFCRLLVTQVWQW